MSSEQNHSPPSATPKWPARLLAFYLPQFHPIPENDRWWGKGFTEWTNVAKARRLFPGHYQPRVPADLGFYDLRVPETRTAQAELAREHGIEGFCYWHYWFAGKRLLERPFNEVLASGEPRFPFCLSWANHSWTGIWHGAPDRLLIEQTYPGKEDYRAHFYEVLRAFEDERYITVDGRPLFLVYRPRQIPDTLEFTDCWRELALKEGLKGLYLVGIVNEMDWRAARYGFDASTTNPPDPSRGDLYRAVFHKMYQSLGRFVRLPRLYSYRRYIEREFAAGTIAADEYPCVIPNWDNTPRSGCNGLVLTGSTPELYGRHLKNALDLVANRDPEFKIVFIKSWNEWAEGNYLEPDVVFGRAYLEQQVRVLLKT